MGPVIDCEGNMFHGNLATPQPYDSDIGKLGLELPLPNSVTL